MVYVKMVNCHVFFIIIIVIFVVHINKLKKVSVYNQMATSEVANNFTHVLTKF